MDLGPADKFYPPEQLEEYRIQRHLGSGAMGHVYLAHDTLLDRPVAIKFLAVHEPRPEQRSRFLTEARALARLLHPNIVTVYRVGDFDGRPYLVSEYIRGQVLTALPRPCAGKLVLQIALGLGRGLHAAHRRGVLHRDLKPANAILADDGEAKLLDFGLAKLLQSEEVVTDSPPTAAAENVSRQPPVLIGAAADATTTFTEVPPAESSAASRHFLRAAELTQAGAVLGTPRYMPPEAWQGEEATARSDFYSLGSLLFELAAGRPPLLGATRAELQCAAQQDVIPPLASLAPGLDVELSALIDHCLARDPFARPSSAAYILRVLERIATPAAAIAIPEGNPYRGLQPFEEEHRALFFGRGQDLSNLQELLRYEPLVLVTGDSGVGKSSLCRAGVLPAITHGLLGEKRVWRPVTMTPGRRPLVSLAAAIAPTLGTNLEAVLTLLRSEPAELGRALLQSLKSQQGVVLFIDQLEELLTQSHADEAKEFSEVLDHLTSRLPGVRTLATVRGDFLLRLLDRTGLTNELNRAIYILTPMKPAELREAIVGPARTKGVRFESETLVTELVASASVATGGLPLLQFALAELWEARDLQRGVIAADALAGMQGVTRALAGYADGILERLLPNERVAARRVLRRLVTADGTRASCQSAELLAGSDGDRAANATALNTLVRARLVVARQSGADGALYELAHEALLSGWTTLNDWLSQDAERRAAERRVETAAADWQRRGRPQESLWAARLLSEVDTVQFDERALSAEAREFMNESRRAASRRRRSLLLITLGLCTIPIALLFAYVQWSSKAKIESIREGERIIRLSHSPGHEVEALRAAIKLVEPAFQRAQKPTPESMQALIAAITAGGPLRPPFHHAGAVRGLEFSPNDQFVLSASEDGTAALWSVHSGARLWRSNGHYGPVTKATFSPDGHRLLTAGQDGMVRLWDTERGVLMHEIAAHTGGVRDAIFLCSSELFATVGEDSKAHIWQVGQAAPVHTLTGHVGAVTRVLAFPGCLQILTLAKDDTTPRVWDTNTGVLVRVLTGHVKHVITADITLDGKLIATGSDYDNIMLWDAATGERRATFTDNLADLSTVHFSRDGKSLVSASKSNLLRVWDISKFALRLVLRSQSSGSGYAEFSWDDSRIASAGEDAQVRVWDALTGQQLSLYSAHTNKVLLTKFSHDGKIVASSGEDGLVQLWDGQSGALAILKGDTSAKVRAAEFLADNQTVVTVSGDNFGRSWNAATGKPGHVLSGHRNSLNGLAISADAKLIATVSEDKTAILWDAQSGQRLFTLDKHTGDVFLSRFSADGTLLITASFDGRVGVWSTQTGQLIRFLDGHRGRLWSLAVSPDAQQVAAAADQVVLLWKLASGEPQPSLIGHQERIKSLAYSPDGRFLGSASNDRTGRIWDLRKPNHSVTLLGHRNRLVELQFSPDSTQVLTASTDGSAKQWNSSTGQLIASLDGHFGALHTARFSSRGDSMVTASEDGSVKLWDASSGGLLGTFSAHTAAVFEATFSPDGNYLVTASNDYSARVFPISLQKLVSIGKARTAVWESKETGWSVP